MARFEFLIIFILLLTCAVIKIYMEYISVILSARVRFVPFFTLFETNKGRSPLLRVIELPNSMEHFFQKIDGTFL